MSTEAIYGRTHNVATVVFGVLLLLFSINTGKAQKFPSCTDAEAQRKTVSLLTRWFENETKEASGGSVKLTSIDIQRISPRNARFGNSSGILECEVTANANLLRTSTGQRFQVPAFQGFVLYFGYDQDGELVVQTPSGMR